MEHLWAPWRLEYITSDNKEEGCIFCVKSREDKDKENLILERGEKAFIIMNAFPYNNGHLMVAPYQHTGELLDLDDEEMLSMMNLVKLSKEILDRALRTDGYNVGINLGRSAGAGIADHIHVHIVPRWSGDTNFMPVLADVRVMPEALESTYARLKDALEELERSRRGDG